MRDYILLASAKKKKKKSMERVRGGKYFGTWSHSGALTEK